MSGRVAATVLGALLLAGGTGRLAPDAVAADARVEPGLRVVRVRVACDEEFRARDGWAARARALLVEASRLFEREILLRFEAVQTVAWVSDDAAPSIHELLWGLADRADARGIDLVVGFTGQARPSGRGGGPTYARGAATTFGRAAIVRLDGATPDWPYAAETVAHELAHVLGAWHCRANDSLMRPRKNGAACLRFDPSTRMALALVRDFDFSRGVEGLDEPTIRTLTALWTDSHADDAMVPVAHGLVAAAVRRAATGGPADADRALVLLRRARALLVRCDRAESREMLDCLLRIGRLEAQQPRTHFAFEALERAAVLEVVHQPERLVALPWLARHGRHYRSGGAYPGLAEPILRGALAQAARDGTLHSPAVGLLHEGLAWVLEGRGRTDDARRSLREALEIQRHLAPADVDAQQRILRRLGGLRRAGWRGR